MEPNKIILNESKGEKDFESPYKLNFWHKKKISLKKKPYLCPINETSMKSCLSWKSWITLLNNKWNKWKSNIYHIIRLVLYTKLACVLCPSYS